MAFDPAEFANLGRQIVNNGGLAAEARARTALGRAYYTVFLAVRSAIRSAEGRPTHGRGDRINHGNLTDQLFSTGDAECQALGKVLQDLYTARRKADYELEPEGPFAAECLSPKKADHLLRKSQAALRRIPAVDFKIMAGRLP